MYRESEILLGRLDIQPRAVTVTEALRSQTVSRVCRSPKVNLEGDPRPRSAERGGGGTGKNANSLLIVGEFNLPRIC